MQNNSTRLSRTGWMTLFALLWVIIVAFIAWNMWPNQPSGKQSAATSAESSHDISELSKFIDSGYSDAIKSELVKATDSPWDMFVIRDNTYNKSGDNVEFFAADTQTAFVYKITASKHADQYNALVLCAPHDKQINDRTCIQNAAEGTEGD